MKIRAYGATRLYTLSHELPALTALAQHTTHSHSDHDETRPTVKFVTNAFRACSQDGLLGSVRRSLAAEAPPDLAADADAGPLSLA